LLLCCSGHLLIHFVFVSTQWRWRKESFALVVARPFAPALAHLAACAYKESGRTLEILLTDQLL
jgi:hypothetical protein